MLCPSPRGPASESLSETLTARPGGSSELRLIPALEYALSSSSDVLRDGDLQLTLFLMYQLSYSGVEGVDDGWEWDLELLRARASIEARVEEALRSRVPLPDRPEPTGAAVASSLFEMTGRETAPGLSHFVASRADVEQLRELLIHRSVYQLMEADPHSWAIPRLEGRAKAALVEIQADEYGGGRPERMHAAMFAQSMRGVGLDDTYGRYVDELPAITLAWVNVVTMFGLHRRWRGAVCGHLAALEMTSSAPNRRYGNGFRRHGFGPDVTAYFDEHVEADAVHEQIAARDLAGALIEQEPALLEDVMFGASVCLAMDDWVAEHLIGCWEQGASSLRLTARAGA